MIKSVWISWWSKWFWLTLPGFASASEGEKIAGRKALQTYIDLLLPEDEWPGALQLGAEQIIIDKALQDPSFGRLIRKGVLWLNFLAKKLNVDDFADLPQLAQLKIIALSEKGNANSLPNQFYQSVRQEVFTFYYSHPEIMRHFRYARPPQPLGFPDFTKPPQQP
ncbi:gluconate 2-dehydrogenase subunit 3 family protein [Methylomarinum vadi]|uniref:gluconate 2-dehydrogenase subunit 3 family protein n=1 Tax=Methylomarinum vadi TaxID=438855 RepID=UPI001362D085|nr:gluconate 2-dehydrogenase subunit 3 family protein [Methylomarinum vadi]